jgi:hypothetical protein
MSIQIDYNDPRYAQAAAEILRRKSHDRARALIIEASIISGAIVVASDNVAFQIEDWADA